MRVEVGTSGISPADLKPKGMVGRIMYEVLCFSETGCKDKEARLELLEATARGIIKILNSNDVNHELI